MRRYPSMTSEVAEQYASTMLALATQSRGVIRDINPKVRTQTCFYFSTVFIHSNKLFTLNNLFFIIE